MHRTFIAIPVPRSLITSIGPAVDKLKSELPPGAFHFVDPENWHITLSFLGDQDDESVGRVATVLPLLAAEATLPEEMCFERIRYWQSAENPSAIVLLGNQETTELLGEVRNFIEDGLVAEGVRFRPDNRRFVAHITLARRTKESVLLPEIDEPADIRFVPPSIDFLESFPVRSGSRYEVLTREILTGDL